MNERSAHFQQVLDEVERQIRDLPTEQVVALDYRGDVLLSRRGSVDRVDMSDVPASVLQGHVLTHNHPQGKSFSVQDVQLLLATRLGELRAVTKEHRFSLMLPSDTDWEDIEPLVRLISQRRYIEARLAVNMSDLTSEQADLLHWHHVWTEVADIRGWSYRREDWSHDSD